MDIPKDKDIEQVKNYIEEEFTDEISLTKTSSGLEIKVNDWSCKEELYTVIEENNVRFDRQHPQGYGSFRLENKHPYALIIAT